LPDEFAEPDWEKLNAIFAEHTRWANLSVTIGEITKANKSLIHDLSRYDSTVAVPLLASLFTLPKLQSHCIRLEILVALAVVHCRGRKRRTSAKPFAGSSRSANRNAWRVKIRLKMSLSL